jgi:hypothetical protein
MNTTNHFPRPDRASVRHGLVTSTKNSNMTKILRAFASSLFIVPLLLGCKTISSPELISFVAARAGEAAQYAVTEDLRANPKNRPLYVAGVAALDGLSQSVSYSSADFKAALAALPIFKNGSDVIGRYGGLALTVGVAVFDLATMFGYDVQTAPALLSVTVSVRNAVQAALDTEPAIAKAARELSPPPEPRKLIAKRSRSI